MQLNRNRMILGLLVVMALILPACPEASKKPDPEPAVAQIVIPSGSVTIRKPGSAEFSPLGGTNQITRGTTLNVKDGIVTLNFMGCVQVQVGEQLRESELILEGSRPTKTGGEFVLALTKGEAKVDSSADCPVVLKLPHGEVRGLPGAFFQVRLTRFREGRYTAVVQAMSKGNIEVSNDHGRVILPYWSTLRLNEEEPPAIIKEKKSPVPRRRGP